MWTRRIHRIFKPAMKNKIKFLKNWSKDNSMKLWIFAATIFLFPMVSVADFGCTSEVRYSWIRKSEKTAGKSAATPTSAPTASPDGGSVPTEGKIDVFWTSVDSKGASEEEAKRVLTELINKERARSDTACRDLHENQSKCIATKYSLHAAVMKVMSFEQRKDFEKKMIEDCDNQSGQCAGAFATEPKCQEIVAAKAEGEGGKAGDSKGKEKEAKKK